MDNNDNAGYIGEAFENEDMVLKNEIDFCFLCFDARYASAIVDPKVLYAFIAALLNIKFL